MSNLSFLELTDDSIIEILFYLTKTDLITLTSIIHPNRFKDIIQRTYFNFIKVCPWTFQMKIKGLNELVSVNNIQYVSKICQKLIINSGNKNYRKNNNILLENDNIKELHIDIPSSRVINIQIKCPKLKKLTFVYCYNLNDQILKNIIMNCQKLEIINIIFSGEISDDFITNLQKEKSNIFIKIH